MLGCKAAKQSSRSAFKESKRKSTHSSARVAAPTALNIFLGQPQRCLARENPYAVKGRTQSFIVLDSVGRVHAADCVAWTV